MNQYKTTLAIAILASAGLTACGGSSGGGDDTPPPQTGPDSQNWQTDFSNTDRYSVTTSPAGFSLNPLTLAVNTTETVSAEFDGPFTTDAGQSVTPAAYFGAVDPNAADPDDDASNGGPFWDGWTIRDPNIGGNLPGSPQTFHPLRAEIEGGTLAPAGANACDTVGNGLEAAEDVAIFGVTFPVCVIRDGDLDGDFTLPNSHIFLLDGTVQVGNGDVESASDPSTVREDVLTIEEGTQIFGISETDPSLVITRGSRIEANGTADLPIIFGAVEADTSASPVSITDSPSDLGGRGDWGSLVISGYGEVNNADSNNQTTTEAVPDGVTRWFGGTDNSDSSGTLEYVILAETGEAFRPDEEVQGLTIEAAGSGTTINHIQITNSDDDGIEWFGGAANASYVVIQANTDDALDIDLGYQGTIQHVLVRQGANSGDRGIESDNNGSAFGATPKTSPAIANVTILGNAGNGGTADSNTMGALHREGFGGQVYRSVYADDSVAGAQFDEGCLDVDDELDETLEYGDVLFSCAAGSLVSDDDT
ncbi:hypothetical protein H0Z60_09210 [Ectothiorhodospiraceae bacterium WFHF3C12]|nr:hypothetical protein [Ectothiorhodospiraceae bacterium WFHF3C12]